MTVIHAGWDATFTATSLAASTVTNGSAGTTAAIDCDGKSSLEVSISCVYGGTANNGLKVFILRMIDDTPTYEAQADIPQGVELAYSISGTHRKAFTIDCRLISKCKIEVQNDSGASVTVTVNTKFMEDTAGA